MRLLIVDDEAAIRFALAGAEARRRGADAFLQTPLPLVQLEAAVDSLIPVES